MGWMIFNGGLLTPNSGIYRTAVPPAVKVETLARQGRLLVVEGSQVHTVVSNPSTLRWNPAGVVNLAIVGAGVGVGHLARISKVVEPGLHTRGGNVVHRPVAYRMRRPHHNFTGR